jgi:hypothetical protein
MNVPGWGMPKVRELASTVSLSRPYRRMIAEPGSEMRGKVIRLESANCFSVSFES